MNFQFKISSHQECPLHCEKGSRTKKKLYPQIHKKSQNRALHLHLQGEPHPAIVPRKEKRWKAQNAHPMHELADSQRPPKDTSLTLFLSMPLPRLFPFPDHMPQPHNFPTVFYCLSGICSCLSIFLPQVSLLFFLYNHYHMAHILYVFQWFYLFSTSETHVLVSYPTLLPPSFNFHVPSSYPALPHTSPWSTSS